MKIDKRIVKYRVRKPDDKQADDKSADSKAAFVANDPDVFRDKNGKTAKVIRMHEKLERPEVLIGSTYKIKTPVSDHAMYVTINDIVLNEGTEHEQRRPALDRLGQPGHRVRQPGPLMHAAHADAAARACVSVGHADRAALVAGGMKPRPQHAQRIADDEVAIFVEFRQLRRRGNRFGARHTFYRTHGGQ